MWHRDSVVIKILSKGYHSILSEVLFPPQAGMKGTVLSPVFTTCPESVLLQKLMWIVPVKNNIFPCPG